MEDKKWEPELFGEQFWLPVFCAWDVRLDGICCTLHAKSTV